ncbi:MAG: ABC transporter permease [Kofleriaceae bacterium]
MFGYYLDLARRSLKRNVSLTTLMILAIGFGVGASMTTLTLLHILSADPIPQKSKVLHYVQLDPKPMRGFRLGQEPNEQSSRRDAENLIRDHRADKQALMTGGSAPIEPQRPGIEPFLTDGRWTTNEFFSMFDVPFVAGGAWTQADDDSHARVAVISKDLAEKLFGNTNAVGFTVRVSGVEMRVAGVIGDWRPTPHFYDLNVDKYGKGEQILLPWTTSRDLKLGHDGSMNCWESNEDSTALDAPCEWIQVWVELDSDAKLAAYNDYLIHYSEDQQAAGRYQRPPNVQLRNVMEWLDFNKVVPDDAKLQTYIALGFLIVCLVNTVGLLLTKFLRRSSEIGVRRALGASKRTIFMQLLVEAGSIGVIGGILGLLLALAGLWVVRTTASDYGDLAHIDLSMLIATLVVSVVASLLAGLLPAWRGCQVAPALQLKSL